MEPERIAAGGQDNDAAGEYIFAHGLTDAVLYVPSRVIISADI